jgi:hypothetical protein
VSYWQKGQGRIAKNQTMAGKPTKEERKLAESEIKVWESVAIGTQGSTRAPP